MRVCSHQSQQHVLIVAVTGGVGAACFEADLQRLSPMTQTLLTVLTVLLTVLTVSSSVLILMILLPARPSRLNVISMPSACRNVCARRRRPASARGFLGQPARSVEMPSLLLWSAPARRRSAALPVHELRSAMISRTQVAIGSASIMHSIAPLGSTQRLASTGSNRLSELSAVAISDLRLGKVSPAAGLRRAPEQPLARRVLPHPPKVELLSERSHPNAAGLDDGEVTSPIVTCRYQVGEPLSDIARPRHRRAQQDDTARARQRRSSGQFAEILVQGEQNALLAGRPCQHVPIGRARRCYPDPNDVVPGCLKSGDRRAREILVGEEAHFRLRSGIPSPSSMYRAHRQDTR